VHKHVITFAAILLLGFSADAGANETSAATPRSSEPATNPGQPNSVPTDDKVVDERGAVETTAAEVATIEAAANETLAVEAAIRQFYAGLNAVFAGDTSGMDEIWSHANTVTYMGPVGGMQVGWDAIQTMWRVQADMKLDGRVEATDLHVTIGNDLALVENYEIGSGRDAEGRTQKFRIRATSSFRKENGKWKMIGHHTDLIDALDAGVANQGNAQSSSTSTASSPNDADDDSINVNDDEVILKLEE